MTKITFLLSLIATILACSLFAEPALAQRVFVSATGSDSNPCSFASPCRSFQHAHDVTSANGEIDVLDPAGYGALTITKAISIQAHGFAGISVPSGGNGITINAGSSDKISLNGLLIDGAGGGQNGIVFNSGTELTVTDCIVRNMVGDGLDFLSSATTTQKLAVSNSYFYDIFIFGIYIAVQSSGTIRAAIDRTELYDDGNGLFVNGGLSSTGVISVAVTDSVAANGFAGFRATADASSINLSLTHSLAEGNNFGLEVAGIATLWLAQSTVIGNGTGYSIVGSGVLNSFGDNYFAANSSNTGSLTTVGRQ